ncbi:GntR family transcriptional regulator [Desertimonas flava]|uniref:GntR family transcriptional regulator n=1 Tax=Desertimonas flava TaxID=2064846 RepID=UPI000E34F3B2
MARVAAAKDASTPGTPVSKTDQAYAHVRGKILDGSFPPGSRLVIEQIARDIGISVVPVREAIRRLEAEGYISYTRNVGAAVANVDLARYPETAETLAILESAATALAVPNIRPTDLAKARRINDGLRRTVEALDPIEFTKRNHQFHRVLFDRCPNVHLAKIVEREWSLLGTTRRSAFTFVPERALSSVDEHEELLRLIEIGASIVKIEQFARDHRLRTMHSLEERIGGGLHGDVVPETLA